MVNRIYDDKSFWIYDEKKIQENIKKEKKDGWNWFAFIFGGAYYVGYSKFWFGLFLYLIPFIVGFFSIDIFKISDPNHINSLIFLTVFLVHLYCGFRANNYLYMNRAKQRYNFLKAIPALIIFVIFGTSLTTAIERGILNIQDVFPRKSLNDLMQDAIIKSKESPMMIINNEIKLKKVSTPEKQVLLLDMAFIKYNASDINFDGLTELTKERTCIEYNTFLENDLIVKVSFFGANGYHIYDVPVTSSDCL